MASETSSPARFTPLQPASRRRRILAFVVGPLLWLVAALFVSVIVHRTRAIAIGLLLTLVSFVLSLAISLLARRLRLREERDAEPT